MEGTLNPLLENGLLYVILSTRFTIFVKVRATSRLSPTELTREL